MSVIFTEQAMLGKLALDIIHGSEYLHSNNVVHGSLAARNILIEKSISRHRTHFNAKVTDYGIMQHFEASGGNYIKVSVVVTTLITNTIVLGINPFSI